MRRRILISITATTAQLVRGIDLSYYTINTILRDLMDDLTKSAGSNQAGGSREFHKQTDRIRPARFYFNHRGGAATGRTHRYHPEQRRDLLPHQSTQRTAGGRYRGQGWRSRQRSAAQFYQHYSALGLATRRGFPSLGDSQCCLRPLP